MCRQDDPTFLYARQIKQMMCILQLKQPTKQLTFLSSFPFPCPGCHDYWCLAKRTYAGDFSIFLLFLIVLCTYATQYRNGTQGYYLSESIDDIIFNQEMPFLQSHIKFSFHGVRDLSELWNYYNHVLAPALYPTTCSPLALKEGTCLPSINDVNLGKCFCGGGGGRSTACC